MHRVTFCPLAVLQKDESPVHGSGARSRVIHGSPDRLIGKPGAKFPGGFFYPVGERVIVTAGER